MVEFITEYSIKRKNEFLDIYFNEILNSIKRESEMIDKEREEKERINKENEKIENQKINNKEKIKIFEEENGRIDNQNKKIKFNLPYYSPPKPKKIIYNYFYSYAPSSTRIQRVPASVLGENVLGRAILALNLIQIREDLYGLDFEEVKKHEVNHILYHYMTEWEIRQKTRMELPFYTRFH